ncbi:hypothetical protein Trydic_g17865 [Trypoxylus dichotomus]
MVPRKTSIMRNFRNGLTLIHVRHLKKQQYWILMVQKAGNWVPHVEEKGHYKAFGDVRNLASATRKKEFFLHRIITGDEKWIHYDKLAWVKLGEPDPSKPKRNIHGLKVILCTW